MEAQTRSHNRDTHTQKKKHTGIDNTPAQTHIHTHMYIYIYMHTHIYKYTHIHTHKNNLALRVEKAMRAHMHKYVHTQRHEDSQRYQADLGGQPDH